MASSRRQQRHHHFSSSFSLASYLTRSERRKENISRRNTKICACYSTVDEGGSREQMMMMNFSCWCDLHTTERRISRSENSFFFFLVFLPSKPPFKWAKSQATKSYWNLGSRTVDDWTFTRKCWRLRRRGWSCWEICALCFLNGWTRHWTRAENHRTQIAEIIKINATRWYGR